MPSVREFNGGSGLMRMASTGIGAFNGSGGPGYTLLIIVRMIALASPRPFIALANGTQGLASLYCRDAANPGDLSMGSDDPSRDCWSADLIPQNAWALLACTKPGGNSQVRLHSRPLGGAITHVNAGGGATQDVSSQSVGDVWLHAFNSGAAISHNTRWACAAFFKRPLSDSEINGVTNATAQIQALSPFALWDFNQASAATPVADLIGSCNETSSTAVSVVTDTDLVWTYGLAATGDAIKLRASGSFAPHAVKLRAGGSFAAKTQKLRTGGAWH